MIFCRISPWPCCSPAGDSRGGTNVSHPARISRKAEQISAQYPQNSARKGCNWKNKILIEFVTSVVIPVLIENIVSGPDLQAMFDNFLETVEKNHTHSSRRQGLQKVITLNISL